LAPFNGEAGPTPCALPWHHGCPGGELILRVAPALPSAKAGARAGFPLRGPLRPSEEGTPADRALRVRRLVVSAPDSVAVGAPTNSQLHPSPRAVTAGDGPVLGAAGFHATAKARRTTTGDYAARCREGGPPR
jgi:hypothetical protein